MTYERFKMLVEAYGGDPTRWPEAERAAALKFAENDAAAQSLLKEARTLDQVIDLAETAPATPQLQERILADFDARNVGRAGPWTRLIAWAPAPTRLIPATAFAVSLLLGLGVGVIIPSLVGLDEFQGDAALLALGDIDNSFATEMGGGS